MAGDFFNDLDTNILVDILCRLQPLDLALCACVCRRFRSLHLDDKQLWLPVCEWNFGNKTDIKSWNVSQLPQHLGVQVANNFQLEQAEVARCSSFRELYSTLEQWDPLIGLWHSIGTSGSGSLVSLEWRSGFIEGSRILPSNQGSYLTKAVPFLRLGIGQNGTVTCLAQPDPGTFSDSPVPSDSPGGEASWENFSGSGLCEVSVKFTGDNLAVIEEVPLQMTQFVIHQVAMDTALASFGSQNSSLSSMVACSPPTMRQPFFGSESSSPHGSVDSPPGSSFSTSMLLFSIPPFSEGGLPYEMYRHLASKVSGSGGDKGSRKSKRKERIRELLKGKTTFSFEKEHLVRIPESKLRAAKNCPMQGLWKGVTESGGLDIILITYDEKTSAISCKRIASHGCQHVGALMRWTCSMRHRKDAPLPFSENDIFSRRRHIQHGSIGLDSSCEYFASTSRNSLQSGQIHQANGISGVDNMVLANIDEDVLLLGDVDSDQEIGDNEAHNWDADAIQSVFVIQCEGRMLGRLWYYHNGNIGFGSVETDYVVDYFRFQNRSC